MTLLEWLRVLGFGGIGSWLLWNKYLCPEPDVYRPTSSATWPLFAASSRSSKSSSSSRRRRKDASPAHAGDLATRGVLRCVQINVWTGSTYELVPEGGSTLTHLLRGRFGSFETMDGARPHTISWSAISIHGAWSACG
jgi:hypothetical protein